MNTNRENKTDKLENLRKKQAALRSKIAIELVRQQKKNAEDDARLFSIIGAVLVGNAAMHPDFESMLKSILQTSTSLTEKDKKLLRSKGWL